MNRSELIAATATRCGTSVASTDQIVGCLQAIITEALVNDEKVTIPGFLTLDVAERSARTGRNPRTGEPLDIPARKVVRVTAGQSLKRAVAGK
jgi:DNA-binding protein HU-beta